MILRILNYLFLFLIISPAANGFFNLEKYKKEIKIATGSILEGYYNIGINMCRYVEKSNKNVTCKVISTNGSTENLRLLSRGEVDFALSQANIALDAYKGAGFFNQKQPMTNLRQLLNLHDEIFTIIVRDDDRIRYFSDLEGRKITNGSLISASSITYDEVINLHQITSKPIDVEMYQEDFARRLCAGDVDSIIIMTSHPSDLVSHIAHKCEIDFAAIDNDIIEQLISQNSSYKYATLKKHEMYPGITEDKISIGVKAILLTHNEVDIKITQNFINHLQNNIKSFKNTHPALLKLSDEELFKDFVLPKLK